MHRADFVDTGRKSLFTCSADVMSKRSRNLGQIPDHDGKVIPNLEVIQILVYLADLGLNEL